MNRLSLFVPALLLIAATVSAADSKSASIYLDGAVVEQTTSARKGYLEVILPASVAADSLRIKPVGSAEILRVTTAPLKPGNSDEKELETIVAKEELLHDRLKALSVKEEIFKAAAKSQSGKAPRRTKTNPEPMTTIRQGTDYAIAQLEAVYQARRRTEKELAALLKRKNSVRKSVSAAALVAKVWVSPANGAVVATWLQTDINWTPEYQLRIDSAGAAQLGIFVQTGYSGSFSSKSYYFSNNQSPSTPILIASGNHPALKFPVTVTSISDSDLKKPLSVTVVNSTPLAWPQGEISCFRSGSYQGRGVLSATGQGKTVDISCSGVELK
ncbi:MAG: hypothetical protein FIA91_02845 [Geobacter sp.]|nr:hypothetical protein [Geobacter sp.]